MTYYFFINATAPTEIYTLSLHDALPISWLDPTHARALHAILDVVPARPLNDSAGDRVDRKCTRLNSSHSQISYAVLCLKKKKTKHTHLPSFTHTKLFVSFTSATMSLLTW